MFTPLKDRLVIRRAETKTEINGIILAEAAQRKETEGTVEVIGPEVKDIQVGDKVLFGKGDGVALPQQYFERPGDYIIIRDEQVRAILC